MYYSYILKENVVTDNVLLVPAKGQIFKGGYVAIVKENTFQNTWQDKETVRRFRSSDVLFKYLDKHYEDAVIDFDFIGTCLTTNK
jgi:hypothetical protein